MQKSGILKWDYWLYNLIPFFLLTEQLKKGCIYGACDGSLIRSSNQYVGAHSYCLCDPNTDNFNITDCTITPISTTIASLTMEIYGLIAITLLIYTLQEHYHIIATKQSNVWIFYNNEQAVTMASEKNSNQYKWHIDGWIWFIITITCHQ